MPWRWSRWLIGPAVFAMATGYFLSAEPMRYFAWYFGAPVEIHDSIDRFYEPVRWFVAHSDNAMKVVQIENDLLVRAFGPWRMPIIF